MTNQTGPFVVDTTGKMTTVTQGGRLSESQAEVEYPLPVGLQEFEEWSDRIIEKAGKFADTDSLKYTLATNILHAEPGKDTYPDSWFITRLRKAAANQIASQVFQDIKAKKTAEAAFANQPKAEDTTAPAVVENGQEQQN